MWKLFSLGFCVVILSTTLTHDLETERVYPTLKNYSSRRDTTCIFDKHHCRPPDLGKFSILFPKFHWEITVRRHKNDFLFVDTTSSLNHSESLHHPAEWSHLLEFNHLIPVTRISRRSAHVHRDYSLAKNNLYIGEVKGLPGSCVYLVITNVLVGHICVGRLRYFIRPLETANSTGAHLLSKKKYTRNCCELKNRRRRQRLRRAVIRHRIVDVLVVVDEGVTQFHGDALKSYISTVLSTVDLIYKEPSLRNSVEVRLVGVATLSEDIVVGAVRSRNITGRIAAASLLNEFCSWMRRNEAKIVTDDQSFDVAFLLTRRKMCNSNMSKCMTLGLAEQKHVCDREFVCAVVEDRGISTAFTIAHELGHLLGMPHDQSMGCRGFRKFGNEFIMSNSLDQQTNVWEWSPCSRHHLSILLSEDRVCLEESQHTTHVHYTENALRTGETYHLDEQCRLMNSANSRHCPQSSDTRKCRYLWCSSSMVNSDECYTQYMPWAEGTPCGPGTWCRRGHCVKRPYRARVVDGAWGSWQRWSECSRQCGGGVRRSSRRCNSPAPRNGGRYCTGRRTRYLSCNVHDCPQGYPDFRAEQCRSFDFNSFHIRGVSDHVRWLPYSNFSSTKNRCRLYCRVAGSSAFYMLKKKVIDGTKCSPDSNNICVNGRCEEAGCDNVLHSKAQSDMCGVCGGDNSTCIVVEDTFIASSIRYGYNHVAYIPEGAINLYVQQISRHTFKDENYIVVRESATNKHVLNGDNNVSMFAVSVSATGTVFAYSGASVAMETLSSERLDGDFELQVLSVGTLIPPDIRYRYVVSVSKEVRYTWHMEEQWSKCDRICQGTQYRKSVCVKRNSRMTVHDSLCENTLKTRLARVCNLHCSLSWGIETVTPCSAVCGAGERRNVVFCQRIDANQLRTGVDSTFCQHIIPRPSNVEACHINCSHLQWQVKPWSRCNMPCGEGIQERIVTCINTNNNLTMPKHFCSGGDKQYGGQPLSRRSCLERPCEYVWIASAWSRCSKSCGSGVKIRHISCFESQSGLPAPMPMCERNSTLERPTDSRSCQVRPCAVQWSFGEWTKCVNCQRHRQVTCVDIDGVSIAKRKCRHLRRPRSRKLCQRSCRPSSCREVQQLMKVRQDGSHWLWLQGRRIRLYCHKMHGEQPREYITLRRGKRGRIRNYSEISPIRFSDPSHCPSPEKYSTLKSTCSECLQQGTPFSGMTLFHKLHLNITTMTLIATDFTFTSQNHGVRIPYGESGDCFSQGNCPQGRFSIFLKGTGLQVSGATVWKGAGNNVTVYIRRNQDGTVVTGRCGGYCGVCRAGFIKLKVRSSIRKPMNHRAIEA